MIKQIRNMAVVMGCLAGMTACQRDEVAPRYDAGERILFGTPMLSVESESRSTLQDALEAGDKFGVIGYCLAYTVGTEEINYNSGDDPWSGKRNNCPPLVFYGEPVTVGAGGGCTYDYTGQGGNNPKYWYRDGYDVENKQNEEIKGADNYSYSFYAYYPHGSFSIDAPSSATKAGTPRLTFTMPQNGSTIDTPLKHSETLDAMLGVLYNQQKSDGNLRFNFHHVLTGLRFVVNNYSELDLQVYSIKLEGTFFKKVTVDFANDVVAYSFPPDRYKGIYTLYDGGDTGFTLKGTTNEEVGTSSENELKKEYLMLIAGEGNYFGEDVEVVLNCKFGENERKDYRLSRPGTFTPKPGVKYTAQLNFVGDAFVLQFVVASGESWEDGEMADGDGENDDVLFE